MYTVLKDKALNISKALRTAISMVTVERYRTTYYVVPSMKHRGTYRTYCHVLRLMRDL
jgi:hypothetical protein